MFANDARAAAALADGAFSDQPVIAEVPSDNALVNEVFPFRLHWDAQQLTDAVPLRLHELFDFDAGRDAAQASNAHRVAPPRAARVPGHYAGQGALPAMFRVR